MQKLLLAAALSLVGLTLSSASARAQPLPSAPQSAQQSQQDTKSVAGTIASIGDKGQSFVLEVNQGGNKQSVQFVLDKDSQVKGQVKVGTPVTVEYVAMADQNVAISVTAQG
jgi:ribosomal protein S1